jgi:ABC-type multidrug transport system fused ATPase/permease subunit
MENTKKEKITKQSLKKSLRIYSYILPYKGYFFIGFGFLILSSLTSLAFPMLIGDLFGSEPSSFIVSDSNSVLLVLFIVLLSQSVFSFFRIYLFSVVSENALKDLRFKSFRHLVFSPITFFDKSKVGELTSRIATDINMLQETFNTTIAEFVRQIITIVGGIIMIFLISPKLSGIMLAIVPIIAVSAVVFGKFIKKLSKQAQDASAESNSLVEEALSSIKVVKAYANEFFELKRYRNKIDEIKELSIKGAKWRGVFASFIILCFFGSVSFIVWSGTNMVKSNEIPLNDFVKFILYTIFIAASFGGVSSLYGSIQKAIGATERLLDLVEEPEENISETSEIPKLNGIIEFKNVAFTYPTRQDISVLNGITFTIDAGKKVALVGTSGSGKSTIAALVMRLYNNYTGDILFDGKPATSFELHHIRKNTALVPQEVMLFSGSIKENILYGNPNASEHQVLEAAKQANAWDFISSFPEGLNTLVGDRGVQLSGGQKQRIAIARAILKNPTILILDEATSSLDVESEKLVQDALNTLMQNRTTLIIAHRLSTIQNADTILVLEKGTIVEQGTHQSLSQQNGIYKRLNTIHSEI